MGRHVGAGQGGVWLHSRTISIPSRVFTTFSSPQSHLEDRTDTECWEPPLLLQPVVASEGAFCRVGPAAADPSMGCWHGRHPRPVVGPRRGSGSRTRLRAAMMCSCAATGLSGPPLGSVRLPCTRKERRRPGEDTLTFQVEQLSG